MLWFLFFILAKTYNFEVDYSEETYNTLDPKESPAKLILKKGLSLMMVEWADATLNISIPDELSETVSITKESGLSYFTFSNEAVIELTFSRETSYFVTKCPQYSSRNGVIQYINNFPNSSFGVNSVTKDVYFAVFGPHSIQGSAKHSFMTQTFYFHYMNKNHAESQITITSTGADISIPEAFYSSFFVRVGYLESLTYSVSYESLHPFEPTILTSVRFEESRWDEPFNYNSNEAFGGVEEAGTYKSILISDIKYEAEINVRASLGEVFGFRVGDESIYPLNETKMILLRHPFTVKLYVLYERCDEFTEISTIDVSDIYLKKCINLTDSDIPPQCKSTPLPETTTQEPIQPTETPSSTESPTPIHPTTTTETSPPTEYPTAPVTSEPSTQTAPPTEPSSSSPTPIHPTTTTETSSPTETATAPITPIHPTTITQTAPPIPPEYRVCADLSALPDEYEISYIIFPGDGHLHIADHGMNEETSYQPFYVNASLTKSPYCKETFLAKIEASHSFECIEVTVDMLPKECTTPIAPTTTTAPVPEHIICADLSALPSEYEIGYTLSNGDGHMRVAFNGMNEERSSTPFYINATLMKSPGCEDKFIGTLYSKPNFECIKVDTSTLPEECSSSSDNHKKIIIIIVTVVSIVVVIITVIIIIIVAYKIHKKKYESNIISKECNEKLLSEDEKLERNYVF